MKTAVTLAAMIIWANGVDAATLPAPFTASRSMSGQFVVFGPRMPAVRPTIKAATNANWVTLEPTLVTVSAERIKLALWRELEVTGSWQNKISIALRTARSGNEPINIIADRSLGLWSYRVEMPDQVTQERYLRAMVEVVLLELANRNSPERCAEIPIWLIEGLTLQLQSGHGPDLVLNTPQLRLNGVTYTPPATKDVRQLSRLERTHKTLLGETPLSFEELSWPTPEQITGPDGPRYRACAQLFTHELLKLRGGEACLRNFIFTLPAYLNWQMAFLQGFQPHFSRPLDIEKWWSLQATGFASRDLIQTWTYEESWHKLTATLAAQVDVFGNTNQMPVRAEVKLQTVIRDWEPAKQESLLRPKIAELESLRASLAPELIDLATEYTQCLETYLNQRDPSTARGQRSHFATRPSPRRQTEALQQLDALDARAARMNPKAALASLPARPGPR